MKQDYRKQPVLRGTGADEILQAKSATCFCKCLNGIKIE